MIDTAIITIITFTILIYTIGVILNLLISLYMVTRLQKPLYVKLLVLSGLCFLAFLSIKVLPDFLEQLEADPFRAELIKREIRYKIYRK